MSKKTQLFLVIGLTKEGRHWDDSFVQYLKNKFNTEEAFLVDLPGSGEFDEESSPISIEDIIKQTRRRYKENFDPDARRILVSISLGGMAGASWVEQYPDDFHDFVIINSSFSNLSPIYKRVQPQSMKKFFSIFLTKCKKDKDRKIVKMCSNNTDRHEETLEKWDELSNISFMKPTNIIRQVLAGATFKLPSAKPKANVYVVAAKHDSLAHYSCSEDLAKHWDAPLYLFEEKHIGHALHIDAPEELAENIHNFLNAQT